MMLDIARRTIEIEKQRCRLLLLQALAEDANYSICHRVLIDLLAEYDCSASISRQCIAWLAEHGLLITRSDAHTLPESTITDLGVDIAKGRSTLTGIARPRPGL